jgi:hypothetical protein
MKIVLLFFVLLAGCAYPKHTTPYNAMTPGKGKALVYIYRPHTQMNSLNPDVPKFSVNGNTVGKLSIGGYYLLTVDPGEILVTYKDPLMGIYPFWNSGEVKFTAQANQKYFIRYSVEIEMLMTHYIFAVMPNPRGETEIAATDLLVN